MPIFLFPTSNLLASEPLFLVPIGPFLFGKGSHIVELRTAPAIGNYLHGPDPQWKEDPWNVRYFEKQTKKKNKTKTLVLGLNV